MHPDLKRDLQHRAEWLSQLANLPNSKKKKRRIEDVDSPDLLAARLQFTLTAMLFDRHVKKVFYGWENRVPAVTEAAPVRKISATIQNILPLPITGKQFGTYYAESDRKQSLSMLAYSNIGRMYLLNFHRLFTDLDGEPGPHVMALSGTSYLPHSTSFHVGTPRALLLPENRACEAISRSEFFFRPCHLEGGVPVRLSGAPQSEVLWRIREMMGAFCSGGNQLAEELSLLEQRAAEDPDNWGDRGRIFMLVNSYEQARHAALALKKAWPTHAQRIHFLTHEDEEETVSGGVLLGDVENFATTRGVVLIAPLNAVGRGYNILNRVGKAAFGSLYFLMRPYPHPQDAARIAQELNRRCLDWLQDEAWLGWQEDGLYRKAISARHQAIRYWRLAEQRSYYKTLYDVEELRAYPRRDLAATTLGLVVQAVGRVLRGGVPFRATFVDAAWSPGCAAGAASETGETSLLSEMKALIADEVEEDPISHHLYQAISDALVDLKHDTLLKEEQR